jgi:hypothetical protein
MRPVTAATFRDFSVTTWESLTSIKITLHWRNESIRNRVPRGCGARWTER